MCGFSKKTNRQVQICLFKFCASVMVAALVLSACRGGPTAVPSTVAPVTNLPATSKPVSTAAATAIAPTAAVSPSVKPTATPALVDSGLPVVDNGAPLPPQLVQQQPKGGQELPPGGAIELTFDQPMDVKKTSAAWQVTGPDGEAIQGQISWPSPNILSFSPSGALKTGSLYQARLSTQAASEKGVALSQPVTLPFVTTGELQVSQVFPADNTQGVAPVSAITAIFNRPVVPLVVAEEQANLPQPLVITPATPGKGEWVNTSVYAFHPDKSLLGGTNYTVTVKAGLKDATGDSQLASDTTWHFSTTSPGLDTFTLSNGTTNPPDNTPNILLDEYFTFHFLQPMDRPSTESALSITSKSGGKSPFTTKWSDDNTTVVITPTQRLELNTGYLLGLSTQAQAAAGGQIGQGLSWHFTTVPLPAIVSTTPTDGSKQEFFDSNFYVKFASPMRIATVKDKIVITPKPDKAVDWWYNEWDWSMGGYFLKPSTAYEVRFLPGMQDIYGNSIQGEKVIHFTTGAYRPSASLLMPYDMPMVRANGPENSQEFFISYTNVDSVRLELYSLTPSEIVSYLSNQKSVYETKPDPAKLVWQADEKSTGKLDEDVLKGFTPVAKDGKPLPPGFYYLGLNSPQVQKSQYFSDSRLMMVANANLTFKSSTNDGLVWLTDLESGQPLPGAKVTVYNDQFNAIGQGTTGPDGLLKLDLPTPTDPYKPRFALSDDGKVFGFASSQWGSGISSGDYGSWSAYYAPSNQPKAYLYTERPIYRPGQPVYFKGIVRQNNDLAYSLPKLSQVHLKISNYQETVHEEDLTLTPNGSFDSKLLLDQNATLGYYTIEAFWPGFDQPIGSVNFNVAEYRKPEFQVQVKAAPSNVLAGDNFTADVNASYYSGGPVKDAEVSWTLTSDLFTFTPPDEYSSYTFTDFDETMLQTDQANENQSKVVAQGTGQTDANGHFSLTMPANLSEFKSSRTLTFEATVTDLSKNSVSGRDSVTAHRSAVYPGVKPQNYVGQEGKPQGFDIVALDWNGKPLPGQKVSVDIVERRWYSVQEQDATGRIKWTSTVEEKPVTSFPDIVTDDKGKVTVSFTPPNGGEFKAKVTALDAKGNPGRSSAYIWVAGKEFVPWMQTNDRSFELVSDKKHYLPGDTAQILIASPFQGETYALVTVERGRIHKQEVIKLSTNSTIYQLPVTPDMAPNTYVSVVVVKGVDDTNPRPNFKMGIVELNVDTNQQALDVQLSADPPAAGPREQVRYTVQTRDYQGRPVSAEVSLSLSDLATLSLLPPNSQPILDYFYSKQTLGVWTSVPIVQSLDEYNTSIQAEMQQGAGMGSGGKGGGELGVIEVRQEFPDTAFWDASVITDQNGEATVAVTLPDNLTTWRMEARAATQDTRVGQNTLDLVSSRPLLVRPETPRFFVVNDQTRLGAAVHNNTPQALSVLVSLAAEGLSVGSPLSQTVQIPANSQAYVTWDAKVNPNAQRVDLVFSAEGGGMKDASRPTAGTLDNQGIPVYRYEAPETVGTSGMMTAGGTQVEAISLPTAPLTVTQGQLTIKVSPSLAAGMTDGLTYLETYPFDCVEQNISRFLPNVITTRALKSAGLSNPQLEANLNSEVDKALQSLYNAQHSDGGWGWWSDEKSDPLTSAYVVLGLLETKDASYQVNDAVLQRGLNYLRTQVVPIVGLTDPDLLNRQAFILYVLARSGQPDVSSTVQLFDQRQHLAYYAQAFLAQALYLIDHGDPRLQTMLADFNGAAITSATGTHWEEKQFDRMNWNTNTRSTAIILSVLSLIDPKNPLNANAVRWLMSSRTDGHWQGTQETAWTLMALSNWMDASGELKASYEYAVALNDNRLGGGTANADTLRQSLELQVGVKDLLRDQANRLAIARTVGPGNLYYTAHLNVSLPVDETKALDQGIVVSRHYYQLDDLNTPVTEARQGDQLLARVTVVVPNDAHYIVIEDPLPAGLEASDQSLNTSQQSIQTPPTLSWDDLMLHGWGWWFFTHTQYRDEKVVLSTDYLPAGTYTYTYLVRASTVGEYRVIPTTAQEFYFPEVYGRGEGSLFTVKP